MLTWGPVTIYPGSSLHALPPSQIKTNFTQVSLIIIFLVYCCRTRRFSHGSQYGSPDCPKRSPYGTRHRLLRTRRPRARCRAYQARRPDTDTRSRWDIRDRPPRTTRHNRLDVEYVHMQDRARVSPGRRYCKASSPSRDAFCRNLDISTQGFRHGHSG